MPVLHRLMLLLIFTAHNIHIAWFIDKYFVCILKQYSTNKHSIYALYTHSNRNKIKKRRKKKREMRNQIHNPFYSIGICNHFCFTNILTWIPYWKSSLRIDWCLWITSCVCDASTNFQFTIALFNLKNSFITVDAHNHSHLMYLCVCVLLISFSLLY